MELRHIMARIYAIISNSQEDLEPWWANFLNMEFEGLPLVGLKAS